MGNRSHILFGENIFGKQFIVNAAKITYKALLCWQYPVAPGT